MTSQYVDVAVRIEGSNEAEPSGTDDLVFNVGVPVVLSNLVEVDGFVQDMPYGFPRVESTEEDGAVFIFRFPRFMDSVYYDPLVEFSQSLIVLTEPPTNTPSLTQAPAILVPASPAPSVAGGDNRTTPIPTPSPTQAPAILVPASPAPSAVGGDNRSWAPAVQEDKKDDEEDDGGSVGAIVGGVVGGVLGLCCCCTLIAHFMKKMNDGEDIGIENKYTAPEISQDEERGNIVFGGSVGDGDSTPDEDEEDEEDEEDPEDG